MKLARWSVLLILAAVSMPLPAGVHPNAPPETKQFEFIVGTWDCKARFMTGPDGKYNESQATWIGKYYLDGWAIEDTWITKRPDGTSSKGVNIRSFNKETGKWNNRWLVQGSLKWKYYESEMVGDTMVMTGGEGSDPVGEFIDRNTFYDVKEDSWSWRKDRSYDGGETWVTGVGYIEATRADKD
jgi:hypothetical protein